MGITDLEFKNRLGSEVAKYDDMYMAIIINDFLAQDTSNLHVKLRFRKALLMSHEVRNLIQGKRIPW